MKLSFRLIAIENHCAITESLNPSFLYLIQEAGLCALKEYGCLSYQQFCYACDLLKKQYASLTNVLE